MTLYDDESDFSISDENDTIDSSSLKLKRLCSLEVDFPSSSTFSSSSTENTKGGRRKKQERRRTIKVDEVLWSKPESKRKPFPSAA